MNRSKGLKGEALWLPPGYKQKYVCVWVMPDGTFVGNEGGEFLCSESLTMGDKLVEYKMRQMIRSMGIKGGRPAWRIGRKISHMEADEQMARLLEGEIPDEQDAALIEIEDKRMERKNGN
jgi:hypothetical protein